MRGVEMEKKHGNGALSPILIYKICLGINIFAKANHNSQKCMPEYLPKNIKLPTPLTNAKHRVVAGPMNLSHRRRTVEVLLKTNGIC